MYFQEGVYHFAESMDDSARVEIDGKVVLNDTSWSQRTSSGDVQMTEGWHDVVFRFGNGGARATITANLVSLGNDCDWAELTLYYGVADGGTDAFRFSADD